MLGSDVPIDGQSRAAGPAAQRSMVELHADVRSGILCCRSGCKIKCAENVLAWDRKHRQLHRFRLDWVMASIGKLLILLNTQFAVSSLKIRVSVVQFRPWPPLFLRLCTMRAVFVFR